MGTYRVEKDGISFYVQPEQIEYYAANGYTVFKLFEREVTDVASERAETSAGAVVVSERTLNG